MTQNSGYDPSREPAESDPRNRGFAPPPAGRPGAPGYDEYGQPEVDTPDFRTFTPSETPTLFDHLTGLPHIVGNPVPNTIPFGFIVNYQTVPNPGMVTQAIGYAIDVETYNKQLGNGGNLTFRLLAENMMSQVFQNNPRSPSVNIVGKNSTVGKEK